MNILLQIIASTIGSAPVKTSRAIKYLSGDEECMELLLVKKNAKQMLTLCTRLIIYFYGTLPARSQYGKS